MRTVYAALAALALACALTTESQAITIGFDPVAGVVTVGDSFAVDVVVSGLPEAELGPEVVSAFDLDVLYDATVLAAIDFQFSDALGSIDIDALTSTWITPGRIDFASLSFLDTASLLSLQSVEQLVLGRLLFDAIGIGSSLLTFDTATSPGAHLVGSDPFGALTLSDIGFAQISVVGPASVPEPTTLWLMLSGVVLMAWSRRRPQGA
jgi:hypothetical protein